MGGVFISYRRDDTAPYAGRLRDSLSAVFGKDQIFRDVDRLAPGERFPTVIEDAVGSCDAFIALIGSAWLTAEDEDGRRRLDDPRDYVRQEIATALRRDDVLVIPVLVEGAPMPDPDDLPEDLAPLAERNALVMSDIRWDDDMVRLVDALQKVMSARRKKRGPPKLPKDERAGPLPPPAPESPPAPEPTPADQPRTRRPRSRVVATATVGVVCLALAVVAVVALGGRDGGDGSPTVAGSGPGSVTVSVRADEAWTDTTVDVEAGQRVVIEASGTIRHHDDPPLTAGPEGNPDKNLRYHNSPALADYDHAALIGKIGDGGQPFYVGRSLALSAPEDGRLYLGINDPGTWNNGGAWTVHVRAG